MSKKIKIEEPKEDTTETLEASPEDPFTTLLRPWKIGGKPSETPLTRETYVDIIDRGDEYQILAEVPGVPREQLSVTATKNSIEILGELRANPREQGYVVRERGYTKLSKKLPLPEEILPQKTTATLEDGLLDVRAPKKTPTPKNEKVERYKIVIT